MTSDKLQRAGEHVAHHMDKILEAFKAPVKITVLVRSPGFPEQDFCMTDDDLAEVAEMVERRREA
jgi:hypothetical protein